MQDRKVLTRLRLCTMRLLPQKQEMLIFFSVIQQEDFIIRKNLMAELHKIHTIIEKEYPEALLETMIVVDGTTGQNALAQAKEFSEVADVSGVILTKLDGNRKRRYCDCHSVRIKHSG